MPANFHRCPSSIEVVQLEPCVTNSEFKCKSHVTLSSKTRWNSGSRFHFHCHFASPLHISLMSDVQYEENIPIVDCDVLEAAKENIQPLASGRRVTALSAVLSTPHGQRESQHNSVKSRHRINITIAMEGDDPDDDPLEAYCRFVYWTLDAYPQGHSAESGLLELLEEATRVLKDDRDGHWRGDMRYLKLWVLYASFVEKPAIIYKFLLANDIGTQHALLYEEHAAVLERAGRYVSPYSLLPTG